MPATATGQWVLGVPDGRRTFHNGQPVVTGLRVLAHGDAIAIEGCDTVYFFSAEELARVESFEGSKLTCARCRSDIVPGDLAVRCPGCGRWHHEAVEEARNCWTYTPRCALCSQPTTTLDKGLQWTPAAL